MAPNILTGDTLTLASQAFSRATSAFIQGHIRPASNDSAKTLNSLVELMQTAGSPTSSLDDIKTAASNFSLSHNLSPNVISRLDAVRSATTSLEAIEAVNYVGSIHLAEGERDGRHNVDINAATRANLQDVLEKLKTFIPTDDNIQSLKTKLQNLRNSRYLYGVHSGIDSMMKLLG